MQDRIYDILLKQDEITWQDILHDLIKKEQMDPWDVNISKLTERYIETVKTMQEMNYYISGKVLLACAFLLKIKSLRLVEEDLSNFDAFLFHKEEEFEDGFDIEIQERQKVEIPPLGVRTPLARKRKVSVADLIGALEKALHVDTRRRLRLQRFLMINKPSLPGKKVDITKLIEELYNELSSIWEKKNPVVFEDIIAKKKRGEKVLTFLSLLSLYGQRRVSLEQEQHFGPIMISRFQAV